MTSLCARSIRAVTYAEKNSDKLRGNVDRGNPNEICQNLHRHRRDYRAW